jgi:acetyl-CoA acetyltransferase
MEKGALSNKYDDRTNPLDQHANVMSRAQGFNQAPPAAQMFGGAGREYRWRHGTKRETFGKISEKARKHASKNPYALFNEVLSLDEIMSAPEVFDPLTRYQCCPPTCGAAAAILCSDEFARKHGIANPVYIAAQAMRTDYGSSFGDSMIKMCGYDMSMNAAKAVYEQAGIGPEDLDVVELHDCFTANELLTYEALGLCKEGEAEKFIWEGQNTYGGKYVTNPSGGLLSKGHPLGATGLAQCTELVWQLRGQADARQVQDAKIALQHNLGLGGACVVTLYRRDLDQSERHTPGPRLGGFRQTRGPGGFVFHGGPGPPVAPAAPASTEASVAPASAASATPASLSGVAEGPGEALSGGLAVEVEGCGCAAVDDPAVPSAGGLRSQPGPPKPSPALASAAATKRARRFRMICRSSLTPRA